MRYLYLVCFRFICNRCYNLANQRVNQKTIEHKEEICNCQECCDLLQLMLVIAEEYARLQESGYSYHERNIDVEKELTIPIYFFGGQRLDVHNLVVLPL